MAPQRVLLEGLNYGQIIPETLDSEIRLVKFQPVAAVTNLLPGVQVRFQLQGTGFLDPYSTYLRFTVECTGFSGSEMRFLDRSAQSFISRLYITSGGVEIERVDDYDIIAAMINDTLYSTEQQCFHSFEGMPSQQWYYGNTTVIPQADIQSQEVVPGNNLNRAQFTSDYYRRSASMLSSGAGASTNMFNKVGEPAWYDSLSSSGIDLINTTRSGTDNLYQALNSVQGDHITSTEASFATGTSATDLLTYDYILNGVQSSRISYTEATGDGEANAGVDIALQGVSVIQFAIPLYSSIVGVLMPQKRYIPLHVLPLDIEFTLSKTALYSSLTTGSRDYTITRIELLSHVLFFYNDIPRAVDDIVASSGIYLHLNNFYRAPVTTISNQAVPGTAQIQMSFNAVNSVHFVFLYQGYASNAQQRKLHFCSHNLNTLYLLNGTFQIPNEAIQSLGTSGTAGDNGDGSYIVFIVELMKAWNKLHDPSVDCGVYGNNYSVDTIGVQAEPMSTLGLFNAIASTDAFDDKPYIAISASEDDPGILYTRAVYTPLAYSKPEQFVLQLVQKQGNVGKCQYGISLEGEQLGEMKTAITGRKIVLPFNVQMSGEKAVDMPSDMFVYLRYDSILNIKPDLSIQLTR